MTVLPLATAHFHQQQSALLLYYTMSVSLGFFQWPSTRTRELRRATQSPSELGVLSLTLGSFMMSTEFLLSTVFTFLTPNSSLTYSKPSRVSVTPPKSSLDRTSQQRGLVNYAPFLKPFHLSPMMPCCLPHPSLPAFLLCIPSLFLLREPSPLLAINSTAQGSVPGFLLILCILFKGSQRLQWTNWILLIPRSAVLSQSSSSRNNHITISAPLLGIMLKSETPPSPPICFSS